MNQEILRLIETYCKMKVILIPRVPDQEMGSTETDLLSHANQPI